MSHSIYLSSSIPYTRPSITERELAMIADATLAMTTSRCYDYLTNFERVFASYLSVPHALATSSCTGALTLGLAALGIGPGDEVILADTNWIATVAPVCHLGAKPVFVDILPGSWCIDPLAARRAITPRTRAIIATHLYGNLADMYSLRKLGEEYGVAIIEDAAEAIGSVYHSRRAGSLSLFATFSFHGSKTITTGEGGMLVTSDPDLYSRALTLSHHGRSPDQTQQFFPDSLGYKFRMSNIQAALGCAQLERVDELVARKREILACYREHLERPAKGVTMNPEPPGTINGAWMPTVVFGEETGVTREGLQLAFRAAGIDARVFFHPLSSLPMFTPFLANRHAYSIPCRAINLPSYHDITRAEQDRVIAVVRQVLSNSQKEATR